MVQRRLQQEGCPSIWPQPAVNVGEQVEYRGGETVGPGLTALAAAAEELVPCQYTLPMLGKHQLINSALAIATVAPLRAQGWQIPQEAIIEGIAQARWPGRLEWLRWHDRLLLVDGAHNPAAAVALRHYLDSVFNQQGSPYTPITWVMGMLTTKDHIDIFKALLAPQDHLHLVPVPGHSSAHPTELSRIAQQICPDLASCSTHPDLPTGLQATSRHPTVLCGSLYLLGHFLRQESGAINREVQLQPLI